MQKKNFNTITLVCAISMLVVGVFLTAALRVNSRFFFGPVIILLGILMLIFAIEVIKTHNKLVRFDAKVQEALSLIDIQLKQRFDLIPNLVETVKGFAAHEASLFKEIMAIRNNAVSATTEEDKIDSANKLVPKMRHLVAVAENYPKLQSQALFKSLMEELTIVEEKIVAARRIYDSNVNSYNVLLGVFPSNIVAGWFGFKKKEMFKIDAGERLNVKVDIGE